MGKQAPSSPDFKGAAQETARQGAQLNRPNTANAFGAGTNWTTGPDGTPQLTQTLGGGLGQAATGLQQQAAGLGTGMDWNQFGAMPTGDAARQQAIDAAYGQSASRLNPMFEQRENAERSRLLNSGIPEGSEAYNNAMSNLSRDRNDAYQGALNSAIGQGTAAGQAIFNQGLQGRQQSISEALRRRGQPLEELAQLQGFTQQPGFNQVQGPNLLGAAQMGGQYGLDAWRSGNQANSDLAGGIFDLLRSGVGIAGMLSDERAKEDVRRLAVEVLPGVPLATWRYREGYGPPGLHIGVVAQDAEKVAPHAVSRRADGMRVVNYALLRPPNAR